MEGDISPKWKSPELSQRAEGCDFARQPEMPAQLEKRQEEVGVCARVDEHRIDAKQEKGTATVLTVKHAEAPLRTQRHACHN